MYLEWKSLMHTPDKMFDDIVLLACITYTTLSQLLNK